MRLDRVDAVAIGANRGQPVPLGDGGSVNALLKLCGDLLVALSAGLRNIEFEDWRLGIFGVEDVVRAVTVGADRCFLRSVGDRMSVNALLVGSDHLHAEAILFHDELLTVTRSASGRNIGVGYTRFGITGGEKFVGTAVAIHAGGCIAVPGLDGLSVKAFFIRRLLVGVTGCATDLFRCGFVRSGFYVGMAIDAREHAAVDRIFEFLWIDVKADRLPVDLV